MTIQTFLTSLVEREGSDLYLTSGAPPSAKFQGELQPLSEQRFAPGEVEQIALAMMNDAQRKEFKQVLEINFAYSLPGVGRFRVNIFKQRNQVSLVARNIQTQVPRFDDLNLPPILKKMILHKNGLVLVVGGTGSGKSSTMASLIDYRNRHSGGHIITIEDPIEFLHSHQQCIINQREVGTDTHSWQNALKNALRQAPDVIFIGEIRDRETMEHALAFSETGHLVVSTLHANNANQALDRIVNFFPEERRDQLLQDLSNNLRTFVSQRLVPTVTGERCAAVEILLGTPIVQKLILRGEFESIKDTMEKSGNLGMQTFDSALFELLREGRVTEEDALRYADSMNNLRLRIKLEGLGKPSSGALSSSEEAFVGRDKSDWSLEILD